MILLSCDNISLSYGAKDILSNISFKIENGCKLGVIGVNGAGKTTLFRIITGEMRSDSGAVNIKKDISIGYLRQDEGLNENESVYQSVCDVYAYLCGLEEQIAASERQLAEYRAVHTESSEELQSLQKLIDRNQALLDEYAERGGYEYKGRVKAALTSFGFPEQMWERPVGLLSGGQKTRVGLLRLLLSEPDILLLDEPTNHLDIHGLEWLETFISGYKKTVMIISHDRYFLDNTITDILELEHTKAKIYKGNYTAYAGQKTRDREIYAHHYEIQQREITRLEKIIEQQRRWGREKNIRTAESKQKVINRMGKIEKPDKLPEKVKFGFSGKKDDGKAIESGNDVLSVRDLTKAFGSNQLFKALSFEVKKRDHMLIIGENGTGKSTLFKILSGSLRQDGGEFSFGYNIKLGYYDQEQQTLTEEKTVLDELWDEYGDMNLTDIRNTLAAFLFRGDDVNKEVSVLSGGERARLTLAKLILAKTNVLLLDEPTNHLDINSREALESALLDYKGTIIAVSHDRYFINRMATRILELSADGYHDYFGSYADLISYKKACEDRKAEVSTPPENKKAIKQKYGGGIRETERSARIIKKIEDEIAEEEARLAALDKLLFDETVASDYIRLCEIDTEKAEISVQLEQLYEQWHNIQEG